MLDIKLSPPARCGEESGTVWVYLLMTTCLFIFRIGGKISSTLLRSSISRMANISMESGKIMNRMELMSSVLETQ
jgi:hypothetical protein